MGQRKIRVQTAQAVYRPTKTRRRNWKIDRSSASGYLSRLRFETRTFYLIWIMLSRKNCEKCSDFQRSRILVPQNRSGEPCLPFAEKPQ